MIIVIGVVTMMNYVIVDHVTIAKSLTFEVIIDLRRKSRESEGASN